MTLPPYYLKVILTSRMACIIAMMMYGRGVFQVFFESFSKSPGVSRMYSSSQVRSPHWNQYMAPLLLTMMSLFLGETSRFLMVLPLLKWVCMQYLPDLLGAFTETLCIWYNNMTLCFNFIGGGLDAYSALFVIPSVTFLESLLSLFSTFQSPFMVFALVECLPQGIHFFADKIRIATQCLGPMGEGVNNTKFCWEVMVTVPLYILVHVGRLPVYSDRQIAITSCLTMVSIKRMEPLTLLSPL